MYIWNWINAVNASRVVTGRDLYQTKFLWDGNVPPKNIENIPVHTTLIKKKIKFSSYIRKFRVEQLQSHI
jgi:hypothetical protein